MSRIFVDTDVCLDLLAARKPFHSAAEKLFSLADFGKLKIAVSVLSFANIDYLLKAQYKQTQSRKILSRFKPLVTVLPVGDKILELALASDFTDFEDAIQYYTALENNIQLLITRNLRDYKTATIQVMSPESFLART